MEVLWDAYDRNILGRKCKKIATVSPYNHPLPALFNTPTKTQKKKKHYSLIRLPPLSFFKFFGEYWANYISLLPVPDIFLSLHTFYPNLAYPTRPSPCWKLFWKNSFHKIVFGGLTLWPTRATIEQSWITFMFSFHYISHKSYPTKFWCWRAPEDLSKSWWFHTPKVAYGVP